MKDDSFWIVVQEGKPISTGHRCAGGKDHAKNLRKDLEMQTGLKWKTQKTTTKKMMSAA